jgi:hypothetical protein
VAEDVLIKMNHAALPLSVGQIFRGTLHQASAGVGDDELYAVEAAVDEVAQERRPAGLVLLGSMIYGQKRKLLLIIYESSFRAYSAAKASVVEGPKSFGRNGSSSPVTRVLAGV